MVSRSLADLDRAAEQAASKAAAARDALERAQADERERRQERLDAHDKAILEQYDRTRLERDITDAKRALTAALRDDPVWSAIIQVGVAERNLHHRYAEAANSSARFGISTNLGQQPGGTSPVSFDVLANLADRIASNLVEDDIDQRAAAREAAADESPR